MNFASWNKSKDKLEQTENGYFSFYKTKPPTLENIALVSIAVGLWTTPGIKDGVRQYLKQKFVLNPGEYNSTIRITYDKFEEKVMKELENINLPKPLQKKVSNLIKPIGFQLVNSYNEKDQENCRNNEVTLHSLRPKEYCRFYDIFKVGGSLYFTMEGIVDNVKSLKELIHNKDQEKDFYCLYELACKYCLEESIPDIWGKISPDKKNDMGYINKNYDYHLVAYWTANMENKISHFLNTIEQSDDQNIYDVNLSIDSNMISLSIFLSNPYSLKYFWHKVNDQEKEANLLNWLNRAIRKYSEWETHEYQLHRENTTILCFLLSQLSDKEQQEKTLKIHTFIILKVLFFDWPWQRLFLPTISLTLDYISESVFIRIMSLIVDKIKFGRNTNEIFREIWFKSSEKLKKSFTKFIIRTSSHCSCTMPNNSASIIYRFLDVDDVEIIIEILKYATVKEKKYILFKMIQNRKLYDVLNSNKLNIIDILINNLPSIRIIDTFKNYVMLGYADDLCQDWIKNNNFQAVEQLFKWGFQSSRQIQNFKKKFIDKNEIYSSLVYNGDYELVNSFMDWYFKSDEEIDKFKVSFIYDIDEDDSSVFLKLLGKLSCCEHGWDLFEKFINYSFYTPNDLSQFKNKFLESFVSILEIYRFDFADRFVTWCVGSVEESNHYKNSFALSEKGIRLIVDTVNKSYPTWLNVNELLNWLSITKETFAELKCKLHNIQYFTQFHNNGATMFPVVVEKKMRWLLNLLDKHSVNNINNQ